jgi:DNA-binding XRE family transcriptional regulator
MRERLLGRGTQALFARKAGISSGTVSKWGQGLMDVAPNFENCIRIANYFGIAPTDVFDMAERPDYKALFLELFPNYEQKPAVPQEPVSMCPERDKKHDSYHSILETILHSNGPWEKVIVGFFSAMNSTDTPEGEKVSTFAPVGVLPKQKRKKLRRI